MFVAGGGVNGGKIHGRFPGLDEKQLKDGDLVVTADYRSLLTEILTRRAGVSVKGAAEIFPNFRPEVLSVMKHLSETPLPANFPKGVMDGLGSVYYDKDALPTPAPTVVASAAATPSPSPTQVRPTSTKKVITCVKGGRTIKVTGKNPKCPTGYTIKP
jgi:hypothetical protein